MLHLVVFSGLCNRLFAIVSGMRYARQTGQELTIYWYIPVARFGVPYAGTPGPEHLHCFFKKLPNITLKTWVPTLVEQLQRDNPKITILHDGSKVIPSFMEKDRLGRIVFPANFEEMIKSPLKFKREQDVLINMPTHPFGFEDDPPLQSVEDGEWRYPQEPGIRFKSQYELELSKFARKLEPVNQIQQIIDYWRSRLDTLANTGHKKKSKMGLHIRRTDLKTDMDQEQLDQRVDTWINRHGKDHVFWITSDDYDIQWRYTSKYSSALGFPDATKNENNLNGSQKSLVDLYLLAHCDHILGTKGSSFSYFSWMLSKDSTKFEIVF